MDAEIPNSVVTCSQWLPVPGAGFSLTRMVMLSPVLRTLGSMTSFVMESTRQVSWGWGVVWVVNGMYLM